MRKAKYRTHVRLANALPILALLAGLIGPAGALAALLDVEPGLPLLNYDNTGTVTYNAATNAFSVNADPLSILFPPPRFISDSTNDGPKRVQLNIVVDNAGNLVGGVSGDDLVIVGAVDTTGDNNLDANGVLLTGEVTGFGFEDSGGPTDFYDFSFVVTGGLLAPFYAGQDIGVTLTSEGSNFSGDFTVNFNGAAKGNVGPIPPEPDIRIKKQVSVKSLEDLETDDELFIPDGPGDPDGGVWFDADTFGTGPTVGEVGATYRLIVTNTGLVPVTNAQISDLLEGEPLGNPAFSNIPLGDLQPGESRIIVSSKVADNMLTIDPDQTSLRSRLAGVDLLNRPDRCEDEDVVNNDNPATKLLNIARVTADDGLMDENPAWVMCVPELLIKKQVSVEPLVTLEANNLLFVPDDPMVDPDAGVWFDADTFATGPSTALNATYRLIVTNTGNTVVTNAQITDLLEGEPLGNPAFANVSLGNLQPGESRIIVSSKVMDNMLTINPDMSSFLSPLPGVDRLDRPDRCLDDDVVDIDNPATKFLNIARVTADDNLMDENPAWVMCVERELIIKKQVSVESLADLEANNLLFIPDDPLVDPDGGVWFDADTFGTGPTVGDVGATYRLIVTNTGNTVVTNAEISDFLAAEEPLGNPAFTNVSLGDLQPGESRIIVSSEVADNMLTINPDMSSFLSPLPGVDLLNRPDRCEDADIVDNDNPATKLRNIARVTADDNLMDEDPAWVMCVPELIIKKQVSIESLEDLETANLLFIPDDPLVDPDGGVWFDADTFGTGPTVGDVGATYRFILTNTGNTVVTNAQISDFLAADEPLGNPAFTDISLGDLEPGESRIIVSSKVADNMLTINPDMTSFLSALAGVDLLDRPDRCSDEDVVDADNPATKLQNIARVRADGNITDEDEAWVMCVPELLIKKQVSVETLQFLSDNNLLFIPDDPGTDPDGGVWFDADTFATGPSTALNATYRLIVTNTGNTVVTNAQISDLIEGEPLGNPAFTNVALGDLEPGESRIIVSSEVMDNMLTINPDMTSSLSPLAGVDLLDRPDRCLDDDVVDVDNPAGKLLNIARVTADGDLEDENPAWVMCQQDCDLNVTKTCLIQEPPVSPLTSKCKGKIQEWTVIWQGAQPINISGLPNDDADGLIEVGQEVTFFNPGGGANDVFVDISGGVTGESTFHLSCSDKDMNADDDNDVQQQLPGRSQDCGKNEGNAKGNDPSFINDWIFEGLVDADGLELDCTAAPDFPTETEQCEFTPEPEALNCDAIKPIDGLIMVWDGTDVVDVVAYDGDVGGTILAQIDGVQPGDIVTVTGMGGSPNDQQWEIFLAGTSTKLGESEFHISCSDNDMDGPEDCPIPQGNGKGDDPNFLNSWMFGGMIGENGTFTCPGVPGAADSVDVIYGFTVENLNNEPIEVNIVDEQLGIDQTETIAANDILELVTDPINITPDGTGTDPFDPDVFKNTVVVTGTTVSGAICEAMDMVEVKRNPPPPPPVSCDDIKPITSLRLVWDGPDGINIQSEIGQVINGINSGDIIILDTPKNQTGNDVDVTITGAVNGMSRFHISCSDDEMDGSEDCGTNQGNGKSNDSNLINDWLLDGMTGENGEFICNIPEATGPVLSAASAGALGGGGSVTPVSDPTVSKNEFKWKLSNDNSVDVFVTQVDITWPNAQGNLKELKLSGDRFAEKLGAPPPSGTFTTADFVSDANKRKIKAGDTREFKAKFDTNYELDVPGDYIVTITFDNGDVVSW